MNNIHACYTGSVPTGVCETLRILLAWWILGAHGCRAPGFDERSLHSGWLSCGRCRCLLCSEGRPTVQDIEPLQDVGSKLCSNAWGLQLSLCNSRFQRRSLEHRRLEYALCPLAICTTGVPPTAYIFCRVVCCSAHLTCWRWYRSIRYPAYCLQISLIYCSDSAPLMFWEPLIAAALLWSLLFG